MKQSLLPTLLAVSALILALSAPAQIILSDTFNRTTGLADTPANSGFSSWGANDNGLGGGVVANYLTTDATSVYEQTVDAGLGMIRFGRVILDYNLAANPLIQAAGGVRVTFDINPTDAGGSGVAGRDWGGVLFADTSSTTLIGGSAAAANANANARFSVATRNSGSLLYKRMNPGLVALNTGNPYNVNFNEPVFDSAALSTYLSETEAFRTANGFVNPTIYSVVIEVYSDFSANSGSTARAWIGPKDGTLLEMDFDRSTLAIIDPAVFTWGANGGQAYLAFVGNAATHEFQNLVISAIPEPTAITLLLLGGAGVLGFRRVRRA